MHALRVAADAVAVDGDHEPVRRAGGVHRLRVPGEDALQSLRQPPLALGDELEVRQLRAGARKERLGEGARGHDVGGGDGAILGDAVAEADDLAGRRHVDAELLLLQRPKPAM